MSIPTVSGAFRGWTKRRTVRIVTKAVVNHVIKQTAEIVTMDIMISPLRPEEVNRKPEEQRAWKWYSFLVKGNTRELPIDAQLVVGDLAYRIGARQPWTEAGYRRYHATEDYTGLSPMYAVRYQANGGAGSVPVFAYQEGASVTVAANTFTRDDFAFIEWNTAADGTGSGYNAGDTLTIAAADVILYAIWEAI